MNLGTWEAQALWAGQGQVMGRDTHTMNSEVAPFPDLYLHHLRRRSCRSGHMANIRFSLQPPTGDSPREEVCSITRKARCCHDP